MEEIYLLTKHANFSSEYIENLPVFKRRFHLNLLKKELDETKKTHDKVMSKSKQTIKKSRRKR